MTLAEMTLVELLVYNVLALALLAALLCFGVVLVLLDADREDFEEVDQA